MKDSPNLDLLRTLAVAMVVASHLGTHFGWGGDRYDIGTLGRLGVAIFFVHTCLVLMHSMERTGAAAIPFFIRRALRIYPLAVVVVLLVAAINWLHHALVDPRGLVSNLLLVQNLTGHESTPPPLWSLPYEVQMYLLLPALFMLTKSPRALGWMLLLFAAVIALVITVGAPLLLYVPCFVPGIMAFVLRGTRRGLSPVLLFFIVAAGVTAIPALVAFGAPEAPLFWALCLCLGFVIPKCTEIGWAPLNAAAKQVATYSYGIYLTHWMALWFGFSALPEFPLAAQLAFFSFALAVLPVAAYRWVERPGIDLGHRLAAAYSARITAPRPDAISPPASSA